MRLLKLIEKKETETNAETNANVDIEFSMEEHYRTCPNCGGRKDKLELLCYYREDGMIWSDFRHILPQVTIPSIIQKCPHCGKYYVSKLSHVLIKDTTDFDFIDPVTWEYFNQSYSEFSRLEKDEQVDYNQRLRILGAFNDEFRRSEGSREPSDEDLQIFKDNMLHLIDYFPAPLAKAELYREIEMFDKCVEQLNDLDEHREEWDDSTDVSETIKMVSKAIRNYAEQKIVRPFCWQPSEYESAE